MSGGVDASRRSEKKNDADDDGKRERETFDARFPLYSHG
jgi:hypothetical protein